MDGSESEEEEHSPLDLQEDHADENEGSDDDISEDDYQDSISSYDNQSLNSDEETVHHSLQHLKRMLLPVRTRPSPSEPSAPPSAPSSPSSSSSSPPPLLRTRPSTAGSSSIRRAPTSTSSISSSQHRPKTAVDRRSLRKKNNVSSRYLRPITAPIRRAEPSLSLQKTPSSAFYNPKYQKWLARLRIGPLRFQQCGGGGKCTVDTVPAYVETRIGSKESNCSSTFSLPTSFPTKMGSYVCIPSHRLIKQAKHFRKIEREVKKVADWKRKLKRMEEEKELKRMDIAARLTRQQQQQQQQQSTRMRRRRHPVNKSSKSFKKKSTNKLSIKNPSQIPSGSSIFDGWSVDEDSSILPPQTTMMRHYQQLSFAEFPDVQPTESSLSMIVGSLVSY